MSVIANQVSSASPMWFNRDENDFEKFEAKNQQIEDKNQNLFFKVQLYSFLLKRSSELKIYHTLTKKSRQNTVKRLFTDWHRRRIEKEFNEIQAVQLDKPIHDHQNFNLSHAFSYYVFLERASTQGEQNFEMLADKLLPGLWAVLESSSNLEVLFYIGWSVANLLYGRRVSRRSKDSKNLELFPLDTKAIIQWQKLLDGIYDPKTEDTRLNHSDDVAKSLPHIAIFSWVCYEYQEYQPQQRLPDHIINWMINFLHFNDFLSQEAIQNTWRQEHKLTAVIKILDVLGQALLPLSHQSTHHQAPDSRLELNFNSNINHIQFLLSFINTWSKTQKAHHNLELQLRTLKSALKALRNLIWMSAADETIGKDCFFKFLERFSIVLSMDIIDDDLSVEIQNVGLDCLVRLVLESLAIDSTFSFSTNPDFRDYCSELTDILSKCLVIGDFRYLHRSRCRKAIELTAALVKSDPTIVQLLVNKSILSNIRLQLFIDKFHPYYLGPEASRLAEELLNKYPDSPKDTFLNSVLKLLPSDELSLDYRMFFKESFSRNSKHLGLENLGLWNLMEAMSNTLDLLFPFDKPRLPKSLLYSFLEVLAMNSSIDPDSFLWNTPIDCSTEPRSLDWPHMWVALVKAGLTTSAAINIIELYKEKTKSETSLSSLISFLYDFMLQLVNKKDLAALSGLLRDSFKQINSLENVSSDIKLLPTFLPLWQIAASSILNMDAFSFSKDHPSELPKMKLLPDPRTSPVGRVIIYRAQDTIPALVITLGFWLDLQNESTQETKRVALTVGSHVWGSIGPLNELRFELQVGGGSFADCELLESLSCPEFALFEPSKTKNQNLIFQNRLPLNTASRIPRYWGFDERFKYLDDWLESDKIWKSGFGTGLTCAPRLECEMPLYHISNDARFASQNDAGSILLLQRGALLFPVGILVTSDEKITYGLSFQYIIDSLKRHSYQASIELPSVVPQVEESVLEQNFNNFQNEVVEQLAKCSPASKTFEITFDCPRTLHDDLKCHVMVPNNVEVPTGCKVHGIITFKTGNVRNWKRHGGKSHSCGPAVCLCTPRKVSPDATTIATSSMFLTSRTSSSHFISFELSSAQV